MFGFPNHTLKLKAPDQDGQKVFWHVYYTVTCPTVCVKFSSKLKAIVFQNIFWNQKHVTNQTSKDEIILSRDSKELFEQRFVKVFDQNPKQVEARNQRTGTPAEFTVTW